nr:membrane protein insertase YidC [Pyrinomonadaceae bacterium]
MMDNSKQSNQSRFFLAAALSLAVLFGWSYFFAPKPKPTDNANTANTNTNTAQQTANTNTAQPAPTQTVQPQQVAVNTPDSVPNRQITIKSDLYEVKLDSKGALVASWILKKNVSPKGETPIFADGSTETEKKPLELISDEARNRRKLPFRLTTQDQPLDAFLND